VTIEAKKHVVAVRRGEFAHVGREFDFGLTRGFDNGRRDAEELRASVDDRQEARNFGEAHR